MKHRNDIDGLRAIAVLAVVLYHVGFIYKFGGGFVGVDIFFVISGYLITGIVQAEIRQGTFSFLEFYHRRARRIFPALFAVYLACILAAAALLFPSQARETARQIVASLLFVSNIAFYRASGYFTQSSEASPLLHTWSLSVEEQFYLLLPVLLFALRNVARRAHTAILLGLTGLSFAAALWMVPRDSSAAFYLVPFRAWELLLGTLLALDVVPKLQSRVLSELAGLVGLALIGGSIYLLSPSTPFPGLAALPACLGAALLLHGGATGAASISRWLGCLPARFVGQISYSLYLWHWPLLVFFRNDRAIETREQRLGLLLAAFVCAVLSWRFIENPARARPYRAGAKRTLAISGAAMAAIAAVAFIAPRVSLWLEPAPAGLDHVVSFLDYADSGPSMRADTCFLTSRSNASFLFKHDVCLAKREGKRNFLLVGDSHAAQYWSALQHISPDVHVLQATASGCRPVLPMSGAPRCTSLIQSVYDDFLPRNPVDTILIGGRWTSEDLARLPSTVRYLQSFSARVIVLGPIVEYDQPLPKLLAKSLYLERPDFPEEHLVRERQAIDRQFAKQLSSAGIEYLSIYEALCPDGKCRYWSSPLNPIQFDYGHLTREGAQLVVAAFSDRLLGREPI